MSSIFNNKNNKNKCQHFTPLELTNTMLDLVGYKTNLFGKTVLENSFGTGNILKQIVIRYIKDLKQKNFSLSDIAKGLSNDIFGVELDKTLYLSCIDELNKIVKDNNIPKVRWSLYNEDALKKNYSKKFDYIIGNPPYIKYKDIDASNIKFIKKNFECCKKGKFDYCYAFVEKNINLLKETGKMVYLIPASIYKNVFAVTLRDKLKEHISVILEYPNKKIFGEKILTSSSIFLYESSVKSKNIIYINKTDNEKFKVSKNQLVDKWIFQKSNKNYIIKKNKKFGDIFNASMSVATLSNKVFIINNNDIEKYDIEKNLLLKAGAPKTLKKDKKEFIIFPYYYKNKTLQHFKEIEFANEYPNTYRYLEKFKKILKSRDLDKNANWFEYGRSQALSHIKQKKLLISSVVTNKIIVYNLDRNTVPYAGIYITLKDQNYELEYAKKILQSSAFMQYVLEIGVNVTGKSKTITCKDINNFELT